IHMRSLLLASAFAGGLATVIARLAAKAARSDPGIVIRLTSGIGGVETTMPSLRLWTLGRMAAADATITHAFDTGVAGLRPRLERHRSEPSVDAFLARFDAFLDEFGSRGPDEYETASDTWGTAPELALAAIERLRLSSPDA